MTSAMHATRNQRQHVGIFVVCFGTLCAAVIASGLEDLRPDQTHVDYAALSGGSRVKTLPAGVTADYLKLDYLKTGPVYPIGAFGMVHSAQFKAAAFGPALSDRFFNYYTHFASLPDLVHVIAFAAHVRHLPSELTIIQIPNPRLGGGIYLLDDSPELAHPAMFPPRELTGESLAARSIRHWRALIVEMKHRLDLLHAVATALGPRIGYILLDPRRCPEVESQLGHAGWLPHGLSRKIALAAADGPSALVRWVCAGGDRFGHGRDGSAVDAERNVLVSARAFPRSGRLGYGDIARVVANLTTIDRLVSSAGSRAVFWVAPVAASDNDAPLNRIMDRIVERAKPLRIVDARYETAEMSYFNGDDKHPNHRFFEWLVGKIRARGWLTP